jgi:hypothetical protein
MSEENEEKAPAPEQKADDKTAEPEKKQRKKPQRRPIWVAIPILFEPHKKIVDAEVHDVQVPKGYSLTEFPGGLGQTDAIRAHLAAHDIDPTNFRTVMMFRGAPLDWEMRISKQTIIRFL